MHHLSGNRNQLTLPQDNMLINFSAEQCMGVNHSIVHRYTHRDIPSVGIIWMERDRFHAVRMRKP